MSAASLAVSASSSRFTRRTSLHYPLASSSSFRTHTAAPLLIRFASSPINSSRRRRSELRAVSQLCAGETLIIDKSTLVVKEAVSDSELWAAVCLRVRTFNEFRKNSYQIEDHKRYLAEIEYEALKERKAGKTKGFRKVSCVIGSLPLSELASLADDLCSICKYSENGEDRVVVGTLDLNQCVRLPNEITGMKPQGIGMDFLRAYLGNVCVAKELQRNGLGYALISHGKTVAQEWGIIHLYVHVAMDNEPAKRLYLKSGFVHESDEPVSDARFLGRSRRMLLWLGLPNPYNL